LQSPDSIHSDYIRAINNNFEMDFSIAENSELEKYKLLRSLSEDGFYDTIETFITQEHNILTYDDNITTDENIYYYKLVAINGCNLITAISDTINNIALQITNSNFINTLSWNKFKESAGKKINYEIFRNIGDVGPVLIDTVSDIESYEDDISMFQGQQKSGKFCYTVRAIEKEYLENYSESNISCVYYKPKVFVPNAFTPNDDTTNDLFEIFFSFIPINYDLIIYNRWGNIVFQTNNPQEFWDGTTSENTKVKTGTYIYYLKIKTPKNKIIEKNGNVTVFYP
jgi:gliding motility-associated-like protein